LEIVKACESLGVHSRVIVFLILSKESFAFSKIYVYKNIPNIHRDIDGDFYICMYGNEIYIRLFDKFKLYTENIYMDIKKST